MHKLAKKRALRIATAAFAVVVTLTAAWLFVRPRQRAFNVDHMQYPVVGADISAHNGNINFGQLAQKIDFIYIKATEGGNWNDAHFHRNLIGARRAGIAAGAYHFFRFDRPGQVQAVNIINTLYGHSFDLPVAIDIEENDNPAGIPNDTIVARLSVLTRMLTDRGYPVVFYVNKRSLNNIVRHKFPDIPLWICSLSSPPPRHFLFWQYSHTGRMPGVKGEVDLNVFNGSEADFKQFIKPFTAQ